MLFYFLTSIVFIAEIIITVALVLHLLKLDKSFIEYNNFLKETKSDIKDIMLETKKFSEQLIKLAPVFVDKIKSIISNVLMSQIKSILGGLTFWLVKKEVEKHVQQ